MRICIDMQGMQTGSRFSGVGRFARCLVTAILKNKEEHEIFLIINGNRKTTTAYIQQVFRPWIDDEHLIKWYSPTPLAFQAPNSKIPRHDASIIYQNAILKCHPDLFIALSAVSWPNEEFYLSIDLLKKYCKTACLVHDFIPDEFPEIYLPTKIFKEYYSERIKALNDFDLFFTTTNYIKKKINMRFPGKPVLVTPAATEDNFKPSLKSGIELNGFLSTYGISRPFIFYSGGSDFRKNVKSLLAAYTLLPIHIRSSYQIVIACGRNESAYQVLKQQMNQLELTDNECILLKYIPDEDLIALYSHCSLFVFPSLSEGFGMTVLEAMSCGAAAIGSNLTSVPEVFGYYQEALFDPTSVKSISQVMEKYLANPAALETLRAYCRQRAHDFSWDVTARTVLDFDYDILPCKEIFEEHSPDALIQCCSEKIIEQFHTDEQLMVLSKKLVSTFFQYRKKIYLDITDLNNNDLNTGIQRLEKNILHHFMAMSGQKFEACPVYFDGYTYRMANRYLKKTGANVSNEDNYVIEFFPGDILFIIEGITSISPQILNELMSCGTYVYGIIHDLIPIHFPQWFVEVSVNKFHIALEILSTFNGIIGNSRTTAEDYRQWRSTHIADSGKPFLIDWFHPGADFTAAYATTGLPKGAESVLSAMKARPSFLEVSTIEPRKGHKQALAAFEALWAKGIEANYVIVGKKGWKMDDFCRRLKSHPELGKQLFWLEGISDEYLDKVYAAASCVLFPSEAEGFGLAVVEGARHGKPLILRDLPVFREIAGDHATYFSGLDPQPLADCLETWLEDLKKGRVIPSSGIKLLTWEESARMLLSKLPL